MGKILVTPFSNADLGHTDFLEILNHYVITYLQRISTKSVAHARSRTDGQTG